MTALLSVDKHNSYCMPVLRMSLAELGSAFKQSYLLAMSGLPNKAIDKTDKLAPFILHQQASSTGYHHD